MRLLGIATLLMGLVVLQALPAWAQAGRSYVVRRVFEQGQKQKFIVNYSLRGDVRSSQFDQSLPIALDVQLEINTEVLKVFENGQARIRATSRYLKQEIDYFVETELPPPSSLTVRITPSGFPAEEELTAKVRASRSQDQERKEDSEESLPQLEFLLDPSFFLQQVGLDIVPGPFYPTPTGAVREDDQWQIRFPMPFLDTQGGKLDFSQATVFTYPAIVKVIGEKEVAGRPVLHIQQVTDAKIDIPLGDTLREITRLRNRLPPRGKLTGTITGTIDYYLALSDGSLVKAEGTEHLKLRAEYDAETIRNWQPDEEWAEWDAKATFRQQLVQDAPKSAPSKPAPPPKRQPPKRK